MPTAQKSVSMSTTYRNSGCDGEGSHATQPNQGGLRILTLMQTSSKVPFSFLRLVSCALRTLLNTPRPWAVPTT